MPNWETISGRLGRVARMVAPQGLSSTAITGPSVASSQADRSVVVGESDVRDVPGVLEVVEEVAGARVAELRSLCRLFRALPGA